MSKRTLITASALVLLVSCSGDDSAPAGPANTESVASVVPSGSLDSRSRQLAGAMESLRSDSRFFGH